MMWKKFDYQQPPEPGRYWITFRYQPDPDYDWPGLFVALVELRVDELEALGTHCEFIDMLDRRGLMYESLTATHYREIEYPRPADDRIVGKIHRDCVCVSCAKMIRAHAQVASDSIATEDDIMAGAACVWRSRGWTRVEGGWICPECRGPSNAG